MSTEGYQAVEPMVARRPRATRDDTRRQLLAAATAVNRAAQTLADAREHRRQVVRTAGGAGLPVTEIARLAGLPPAAVRAIANGQLL